MATSKFYPALNNIVKIDQIPEVARSFVEKNLDKLFYKTYYVEKSIYGDTAYHNIVLVFNKEIGFNLFGGEEGFEILFNPGTTVNTTELSLSLYYNLPILKHARGLNISNLGSPADYFKVISEITKITMSEFLSEAIHLLLDNSFSTFITDFNSNPNYSTFPPLSSNIEGNSDEVANSIVLEMEINGVNVIKYIIEEVICNVNDLEDGFKNLFIVFAELLGEISIDDILDLFIPKISIEIQQMSIALAFPRSVLQPINPITGEVIDDGSKSLLSYDIGSLAFDTENGIEFNNPNNIDLTPSQIGNTGLTIEITNLKFDFRNDRNIPEADAAGYPNDFKGVFIEEAEITLPKKWFSEPDSGTYPPPYDARNPPPTAPSIKVTNQLIGTGGFSGTIGLEGNGNLYKKIGNFWIGLDSFSLTFKQNAITESNVTGKLIIPKFKDKTTGGNLVIDVKAHIGQGGEFNITASNQAGIPVFELEDVFSIDVKSLFIGRQSDADGGKAYIGVSGKIDFGREKRVGETDAEYEADNFGKFLPKDIDIKKMLIYDDGSYEFEGGGLVLPKAFELTLGPVKIGITAIHFGSYEKNDRKYKFFGFDGGVSVNPGGVDARGKGVKLFYTVDDGEFDWFIKLESLAIDIILPSGADPKDAAVIIKGFLSIKDPVIPAGTTEPLLSILKNSTEYAGSVYVSIPKFKGLEVSAAMRLNPSVPSFIVDLGIEISTPILLGTTGLGIYGFRGLFGKKYVATKEAAGVPEDGEWWQYYKAKIEPDYKEGIQISKFSVKNGFSIGAGVSVATTADSGKTLSTKLFFMLSLPDVFLFQGQAAIMKERISLDGIPDPPFFALIAITKHSIEAGFGANYKLPDDGSNMGKVLTVDGVIEMGFFFGNSSAWYVNVGRDTPEARRIQARVFDIFNMYSYLMLSNAGIKAGAGISFNLSKSFGPLKAELEAYIDTSGKISFRPKQIGGAIQLGGTVGMSVCGFGFSVTAGATLAAEAPKPHIVSGDVFACVKVIGKEYCAKFEFSWNFDNTLDESQVPLLADMDSSNNIIMEDAQRVACATNIATGETFPVAVLALSAGAGIPAPTTNNWIGDITEEEYTIPMDSYIDIEFKKPLMVSPKANQPETNLHHLGGISSKSVCEELIPPQKGKSSQVRHEYFLDLIEINYYDEVDIEWKPYDFYNALVPMFPATGEVGALIDDSVLQNIKWGYWQQQRKGFNNKLRILATTPLTYAANMGGNITPEDLGINANTIFCKGSQKPLECIVFEDNVINKVYEFNKLHHYDAMMFRHTNHDGIVLNKTYNSIDNGLYIEPGDTLEIFFNEPMKTTNFIIGSGADSVVVKYYKKVFDTQTNQYVLPSFSNVLLETKTLTSTDLLSSIDYTATNGDVEYIKIEAGLVSNPIIKCIPINVNTNLELLSTFINDLADKSFLANSGNTTIFTQGIQSSFFASFVDTDLYPNTLNNDESLILSNKYLTNRSLVFTISDSQGYLCKFSFELETIVEGFSFANINSVRSISAFTDCSNSSISNTFRLEVNMDNEEVHTLIGKTCYAVSDCFCYTENSTYLYQICYLTFGDYLLNQTIPTASQQTLNNNTLLSSINSTLQPIWRPNTAYSIRIRTRDELSGVNDPKSLNYQNDLVFGFRTAGPIGHFHNFPITINEESKRAKYGALEDKAKEEEFKLKSLKHYIDYDKSYPNADGDLINAKPLFYVDAKLSLLYLYNYVYEFYNNWVDYEHVVDGEPIPIIAHSKLDVIIKDPIEIETVDDSTTTSFRGNNISHDNAATNDPSLPPANINSINQDVILLNNMLSNSSTPCITSYSQLSPIDIASEKTITLKPLKLYTAQFISRYNPRINDEYRDDDWSSVVHSYVFQTSRYANFEEQVKSYILKEDSNNVILKSAVFSIDAKPVGATPALHLDMAEYVLTADLANTDASLIEQYADQFDRLITGVLHISLPASTTTEFNLVINPLTDVIIGIIIQNPEPFNNPKLPKADPTISSIEEFETLELMQHNGTDWGNASDFFVIHSKDKSKMFITKRDFSFSISATALLKFTFKYKLYDGTTYSDITSEVEINLSNFSQ